MSCFICLSICGPSLQRTLCDIQCDIQAVVTMPIFYDSKAEKSEKELNKVFFEKISGQNAYIWLTNKSISQELNGGDVCFCVTNVNFPWWGHRVPFWHHVYRSFPLSDHSAVLCGISFIKNLNRFHHVFCHMRHSYEIV